MAVTMMAFYKEPADREAFDRHYFEKHVPLVHRIPGLQKMEVSRFSGKEAPYYLLATLHFASKEDRKAGLSSPEGRATNEDLANFASPDSVIIAFADIV